MPLAYENSAREPYYGCRQSISRYYTILFLLLHSSFPVTLYK